MRHDVEFRTEDGTLLRGYLHAGEDPAPGIVMGHGFSGVKEQIDHYGAAFATAGCFTRQFSISLGPMR